MSKDKIHIDKLFESLKGYEHAVDGSFSEINDKMHDAAWSDKFDNYEHAVSDIPDFGALGLPKSDKSFKPKAAGKYILLLLLASIISLGVYFGIKTTTHKVQAANQIEENEQHKENNQSVVEKEQAKSASKESLNRADLNSITSEQAKNIKKPANTKREIIANNMDGKNTHYPNFKSNESNPISNNNTVGGNLLNENKGLNNKNVLNDPISSNLFHSNISNARTNQLNDQLSMNSNAEEELLFEKSEMYLVQRAPTLLAINSSLTPFVDKLKKPKAPPMRPTFYGQLGGGMLASNAPFTDAIGKNGLAFHANLGINYGRWSAYTGYEQSKYTYTTAQRRLQVYDSFPHRDINGDTIGWFKKNIRDTTINQNNTSNVVINTIPLHFQFKIIQMGKANLQLGTGLNLNLINTKTIWLKDQNDHIRPVSPTNNTAKFNLGMSILARVGYRISPLTEIYGRLNIREASNILSKGANSYKPSGTQIDFGIRYHLK